nr:hypothetical protein Iba_chr09fCG0010 [Ipomoea batatas]
MNGKSDKEIGRRSDEKEIEAEEGKQKQNVTADPEPKYGNMKRKEDWDYVVGKDHTEPVCENASKAIPIPNCDQGKGKVETKQDLKAKLNNGGTEPTELDRKSDDPNTSFQNQEIESNGESETPAQRRSSSSSDEELIKVRLGNLELPEIEKKVDELSKSNKKANEGIEATKMKDAIEREKETVNPKKMQTGVLKSKEERDYLCERRDGIGSKSDDPNTSFQNQEIESNGESETPAQRRSSSSSDEELIKVRLGNLELPVSPDVLDDLQERSRNGEGDMEFLLSKHVMEEISKAIKRKTEKMLDSSKLESEFAKEIEKKVDELSKSNKKANEGIEATKMKDAIEREKETVNPKKMQTGVLKSKEERDYYVKEVEAEHVCENATKRNNGDQRQTEPALGKEEINEKKDPQANTEASFTSCLNGLRALVDWPGMLLLTDLCEPSYVGHTDVAMLRAWGALNSLVWVLLALFYINSGLANVGVLREKSGFEDGQGFWNEVVNPCFGCWTKGSSPELCAGRVFDLEVVLLLQLGHKGVPLVTTEICTKGTCLRLEVAGAGPWWKVGVGG